MKKLGLKYIAFKNVNNCLDSSWAFLAPPSMPVNFLKQFFVFHLYFEFACIAHLKIIFLTASTGVLLPTIPTGLIRPSKIANSRVISENCNVACAKIFDAIRFGNTRIFASPFNGESWHFFFIANLLTAASNCISPSINNFGSFSFTIFNASLIGCNSGTSPPLPFVEKDNKAIFGLIPNLLTHLAAFSAICASSSALGLMLRLKSVPNNILLFFTSLIALISETTFSFLNICSAGLIKAAVGHIAEPAIPSA